MALILDTGPLFASLDRRDALHEVCRRFIETANERLLIPAPVLPEVDYFIGQHLQPEVRLAFLNDIRAGAFDIEDLEPKDYDRIVELCSTYEDARIGFVDAAVLAIVERLNEPKVVTLDRRHFGMLRPRHVPSLTLLP
jgi:predicted nucleic acid-binding protein